MSDDTQQQVANDGVSAGSPKSNHHFTIPSPFTIRRNRTHSTSERAKQQPVSKGKVLEFCRQRGHGFIQPDKSSDEDFDKDSDANPPEKLFVHISDIEGEYVPQPGDIVEFRRMHIPPRNEKYQAVHVKIIVLNQEGHERWQNPGSSPQQSPRQ